jgi:hypothetical protein
MEVLIRASEARGTRARSAPQNENLSGTREPVEMMIVLASHPLRIVDARASDSKTSRENNDESFTGHADVGAVFSTMEQRLPGRYAAGATLPSMRFQIVGRMG